MSHPIKDVSACACRQVDNFSYGSGGPSESHLGETTRLVPVSSTVLSLTAQGPFCLSVQLRNETQAGESWESFEAVTAEGGSPPCLIRGLWFERGAGRYQCLLPVLLISPEVSPAIQR